MHKIGCDRFLGSAAFGKFQCTTIIISVREWEQLQQLSKISRWMTMTDWHSGTETNRVSTNWFTQCLEYLKLASPHCSNFCHWACFSHPRWCYSNHPARMSDNLYCLLIFL